ncbi:MULTISPECIES: AzlC family ABC transporter permease [unclassified Pseudomonas]|uniref:AzlC family ABC transporter permease n=1 Tax=unclassified Pseudomonas TaxID=196821 RepID=UPI000A1E047D|nr:MULTISPECIES: AzlC family ABC transporter permease [unclassified Pseudomonas]
MKGGLQTSLSPFAKALGEGGRDSITFGVAFIFLYLSIGMTGSAQALTLNQTLATTLLIFSTPLQFLLIQNHGEGWFLIPIVLALNARFVLLSTTLAPYFKETPTGKILASLILFTPSVFTACITRFKQNAEFPFAYLIGVGTPIFAVSAVCTWIGFVAGAGLTSPVIAAAITMLLPLQFTALAGKHWPNHGEVSSYWLGFVSAPLLVLLLKDYNLLITPFLIGGLIVMIENGSTQGLASR